MARELADQPTEDGLWLLLEGNVGPWHDVDGRVECWSIGGLPPFTEPVWVAETERDSDLVEDGPDGWDWAEVNQVTVRAWQPSAAWPGAATGEQHGRKSNKGLDEEDQCRFEDDLDNSVLEASK